LLNSFNFESCESRLMGKMTKAPFTGQSERATDLLSLIHTDVCKPLSSPAGGGHLYFITFTDDFSMYGYLYLKKHKSKSFEKFKIIKMKCKTNLVKILKHFNQIEVVNI